MTTTFTSTGKTWLGSGLNVWASDTNLNTELSGLNISFARLWVACNDPGVTGLKYNDAQMDALWQSSSQINQSFIANSVSALSSNNVNNILFTMDRAPTSWLGANNTLTGQAIVAYARLWVSLVVVLSKSNIWVKYIENTNEPNGDWSEYIAPSDYVSLIWNIKNIAAARAITGFKLVGPGLANVLMLDQPTDPWTTAFSSNASLLDAWSIHVYEFDSIAMDNSGFSSRNYVRTQLAKNVSLMNTINPNLPLYVTEYATKCTVYANGVDVGATAAPNTNDYAFRVTDNLCGMLANGVEVGTYWQLATPSWDPTNTFGLIDTSNNTRPIYDAFKKTNATLPMNGTIYADNSLNNSNNDQTLKAFVASSNNFGMILSRYQAGDSLNGSLTINVPNISQTASNISFQAFPSIISASNITWSSSTSSNGLILSLSNVPYSSIVFVNGQFASTSPSPSLSLVTNITTSWFDGSTMNYLLICVMTNKSSASASNVSLMVNCDSIVTCFNCSPTIINHGLTLPSWSPTLSPGASLTFGMTVKKSSGVPSVTILE